MAIRQKERVGASTRSVEAICSAGVRCDISTQEGHVIVIDEPEARGGTNTGASPLAHLTASLASCQAVQIVKVAEAMRFDHGAIAITANTTTDRIESPKGGEKVMRFSAASLEITIETDEPEARIDRLKVLSEDRCPVGNLFADAGFEPVIEWTIKPKSA
jgi:putative redox protein